MKISGGGCLEGKEARFERRQWMEPQPSWTADALDRRSCLEMMMSRFDIQAALVSVPQLARLIGRSKSTVYASIKEGRFFIPHRMIGDSPMFTVDDVVSWYLSGTIAKGATAIVASASTVGEQQREVAESGVRGGDGPSCERKRRDAAVDDLVARALNAVGSRVR